MIQEAHLAPVWYLSALIKQSMYTLFILIRDTLHD